MITEAFKVFPGPSFLNEYKWTQIFQIFFLVQVNTRHEHTDISNTFSCPSHFK